MIYRNRTVLSFRQFEPVDSRLPARRSALTCGGQLRRPPTVGKEGDAYGCIPVDAADRLLSDAGTARDHDPEQKEVTAIPDVSNRTTVT